MFVGDGMADLYSVKIPYWKSMIEDQGGVYEGVQQPLPLDPAQTAEPYIVFRAPMGKKDMSLPASKMTAENIRHKLGIPPLEELPASKYTNSASLASRLQAAIENLQGILKEIEEKNGN